MCVETTLEPHSGLNSQLTLVGFATRLGSVSNILSSSYSFDGSWCPDFLSGTIL